LIASKQSKFMHITPFSESGIDPGIPPQVLQNLRSISAELEGLSAEIQAGEPRQTESQKLRGRVGHFFKRQLYRLLWWQSYQIKAAVGLIVRWTHEERTAINAQSQRDRDIQQAVLEFRDRLGQIEAAQDRHAREIERSAQQNVEDFGKLDQRVEAVVAWQTAAHKSTTVLTQRVDSERVQTQQLAARLSDLGLFTQQTRASVSIQDRRLALFIEEIRKCLPEPLAQEQLQRMVHDQTQHRYDSLYAAFEDVFRGSREQIKRRQAVYLPLLREHNVGSPTMPILDLGCGRGEWLELLGEHGFQARGVDSNEEMIERCKSLGLQVEPSDSLVYLRTLSDECMGAVSAFHMVEHMPFDVVLTLIDESLRVLKPGGILILETPNPANFLVGTYTFHLDPTHLKPLPSPLLQFFVEGRGFCGVHVRELHPYPDAVRLPDDGGGVASRFNDCLYGPQDYAVIGRKA
jgi:O-antigen chain-terminating methyltransferase